jgi:electron transfer flavoprotein alpha subunit
MRIVVCIKQVPVLSAMQFDSSSRTLKRDGVPTEVSSFDVRAVIKAVDLVRAHGGEVIVLTMGPPQAREALHECLALGADRAVHLCDRAFAGSDTLATARALTAAISREPFDLILCGRYSVDAETGQVGPEVAELLGLAQITNARTLVIDPEARCVRAEREADDGVETVEAELPLLVTAAEDLAPERFPSKVERENAKKKTITTLTAAELPIDAGQVGQSGSPTWVAGLEMVQSTRLNRILTGESMEEAVDQLVRSLLQHGLFGEWKLDRAGCHAEAGDTVTRSGAKDVWVVAELLKGELRTVTFELLSKAAELARRLGSSATVVLFSAAGRDFADELARRGAERLLVSHIPRGVPDIDRCTAILADAIRARQPGVVLLASTSFGRDLAPRVAARLGLGLTGDCIDLELNAEGQLLQYKPAFGGNVVAPILSRTRPEMATVRPGMLDLQLPDASRSASVEVLSIPDLSSPRVQTVSRRETAQTATALDNAEVVVGVGKGLGGAERLSVIEPLVDVLRAALCTTRDVTDEGWLPKQYQIGLTGRAIAPRLYIAVAIRGAMEHMVGVRRAGMIVAINKNPKAPVFKSVDYGIVGDYSQVIPLLVERLQRARSR